MVVVTKMFAFSGSFPCFPMGLCAGQEKNANNGEIFADLRAWLTRWSNVFMYIYIYIYMCTRIFTDLWWKMIDI